MFYSETLLSKTGPLARVWLSANLERKLSKTHILQQNVKDSVDAIVNPNQAPMALRLSGQLLLGVVRIYSRKARYLLDDCNEALMKIKMAFRLSGNNDMPTGLHMPSRDALMLPDVLTEGDNLEMPPMPDASFLLSQLDDDPSAARKRGSSRDINLQEDFGNSQFLQHSVEKNRYDDEELALDPDDLDLGLDLGLDIMDDALDTIEVGRHAPKPRAIEDDLFSQSDLNLRGKDGSVAGDRDISIHVANDDGFHMDDDGDIDMLGGDLSFGLGDQDAPMLSKPDISRGRISESPLSDIDPTLERELEDVAFAFDEATPVQRRPAQRQRRLKPVKIDDKDGTVISSAVIKAQQKDRSKILKPQTFLPRDAMLMALMEMQRNGGFVSNIMADGRSMGWAPELRGLLSLDAIKQTGELKRKRDSGVADLDDQNIKSPRLELDLDDDFGGFGRDSLLDAPGRDSIIELPDDGAFNMDDDEGFVASRPESRDGVTPPPAFDDTVKPLVHPADSGPVSLGTKHAVHLLREKFGDDAADSPQKRRTTAVTFQDLIPEGKATKADATKMFFECLVLATKDAIKVDQNAQQVGAPIKVRGKRGLWGSWAEKEAGGEIEHEGLAMGGATVSVEA